MSTEYGYNWAANTWEVFGSAFKNDDALIEHQLGSYSNFINNVLPQMLRANMPIRVTKANIDGSVAENSESYEVSIVRHGISKPIQYTRRHYRPLIPADARNRNLTYSAPLYLDLEVTHRNGVNTTVTLIEKVLLAKIPVMVNSTCCHLNGKSAAERIVLNECPLDRGGYFIIHGSEKTIVSQERPVDNMISCFEEHDPAKPYIARVEVKSTVDQRFFAIKTVIIKLTKYQQPKEGKKIIPGHKLHIFLPYGKRPIPLCVIFKALGITSDEEIMRYIIDIDNPEDVDMAQYITPSLIEAAGIRTQMDAIRYIANSLNITVSQEAAPSDSNFRMEYATNVLHREFLPHVGNNPTKKLKFIGLMVRRLLSAYNDPDLYTDRDKLTNKRLDTPGVLFSQIFRYWWQQVQKEIKKLLARTLSGQHENTIEQELRRTIQKSNIEAKLRNALSTGNWFTNRNQANSASKKGIAQVTQRLAYNGWLSHHNRVNSPLERAGSKHEPPRRLHGSQPPKICPNETPEGAQVGTVKNLSLLVHVTIETSAHPVLMCLQKLGMTPIDEAGDLHNGTRVLVNGDFVGLIYDIARTDMICRSLRHFRRTDMLSKYTSIVWQHDLNTLVVQTDGGRYTAPYYIIDADNHFQASVWQLAKELSGSGVNANVNINDMDTLMSGLPQELHSAAAQLSDIVYNDRKSNGIKWYSEAAIEYLDSNEDESAVVAMTPTDLYDGQTYRWNPAEQCFCGHLTMTITADDNIMERCNNRLEEYYGPGSPQVRYFSLVTGITVSPTRITKVYTKKSPQEMTPAEFNVITNLNRYLSKTFVRYTHCMIHPSAINGVVASTIPLSDHNMAPRNCYQSSMGKQAIGMFVSNPHQRLDTTFNFLIYPQRPVLATRLSNFTKLAKLHHGYMSITTTCSYTGYNQEDSLIGNSDSEERGAFCTIYNRTYVNKSQTLTVQDGSGETFTVPPDTQLIGGKKKGMGGADRFHAIVRNKTKAAGKFKAELPYIGAVVTGGDVIIPKTKSLSKKGTENEMVIYTDASTTVRASENGVVDMIIPNEDITNNEDEEGYRFCKVRVSEMRIPEIGDKFASRSAQKGTEGIRLNSADMLFNQDGTCPDKIFNPHGAPSRMTMSHLNEGPACKSGILTGCFVDGTIFSGFDIEVHKDINSILGYDYAGDEIMYNGMTGDVFDVPIANAPIYYQRLRHMVTDKMHARGLGPVQALTKQPAEGRSKAGGLRLGEMERDCLIAHGVSQILKCKLTDDSDLFETWFSKEKGRFISANPERGIYQYGTEDVYGSDQLCKVHLPFATHLFFNELGTIMIRADMEVE